MSNAEHLIENAICDYERYGSFYFFRTGKHNQEMAKSVGISLEDVEAMALHVIHAFKDDWVHQGREEIISAHGYE